MASHSDHFSLQALKDTYRRHLAAARREASEIARTEMTGLDPDAVMAAIDAQFDTANPRAPIQDCFSDAFHKFECAIKDAGGEPITARETLSSGEPIYLSAAAE